MQFVLKVESEELLQVAKEVAGVKEALQELIKQLKAVKTSSRVPNKPYFLSLGERQMGTKWVVDFKLGLEKAVDADVLVGGKRLVTVKFNDDPPTQVEVAGDAEETGVLTGDKGANVVAYVNNVDDDGNVSVASPEAAFALVDNVAPQASGAPQPVLIGEREVEVPE